MFKVINKVTNEEFDVCDVTYDFAGYPQFLIYVGNEWRRLSAKYFKPNDLMESFSNDFREEAVLNQRADIFDKAREKLRKDAEDFVRDLYKGDFKED